MRPPSVLVKVDGVEALGWKAAAKLCGSSPGTMKSVYAKRKSESKADEYTYKGHLVKVIEVRPSAKKKPGKDVNQKIAPLPIEQNDFQSIQTCPCAITPAMETIEQVPPDPYAEFTQALKSVKEELRYMRECLLARFHGIDEITEHVRAIERRVIEEKKVRGSYTGGFGGSAEKLG